ncbi:MAG: SEL1-like repeat protein [Hyphomicrobiales bacterium]|nr:SEL1-like repeat protein [Hyphomicrobiales bacterium]
MTSGVPWHLQGIRREVLDSAREAARRAGMTVEEWLDRTIAASARHAGIEPPALRMDEVEALHEPAPEARRRRDIDQRPAASRFSDISARLDVLSRQLDELTRPPRPRTPDHHGAGHANPDDRSERAADVFDRRAPFVERPTTRLDRLPASAAGGFDHATVDQALAEIAARQRALDAGGGPAPVDLPRAPTQGLPDLAQQLRQLNARIETMQPCGLDAAVETLRDDLAEIGLMLKEALPRQAIEALESEIRSLASRLDGERHAGADATAITGIERNLADIRDALRLLTPAEGLVGFDQALEGLAQKIDRIAATAQDPEALKQFEGAILALRGVVSHVASNDALAQLSDEVRNLSTKIDQVSASDAFSAMERRIAAIADALQQSHAVPAPDAAGVETAVRGLAEKLDRLQLSQTDQTDLRFLEERIARLVEKLEASDARLEHLGAIERALADLLIQIESQRMAAGRPALEPTDTDVLKRDVRRTQDTLETVHATLGLLVDRLATIEASIRTQPLPRAANIAESSAAPIAPAAAFTPPKPTPTVANPGPAIEAVAAPRANPSPKTERRPIDPNLPPDHPLEPGAGRSRGATTPAERIAASETAIESVHAPVLPDPAGTSNFIAAARRAARAAASEMPAAADKRAAYQPAPGKSDSGTIRKVIVGTGVVLIVLGTLHFVTTRLWPSSGPTGDLLTQTNPEPAPPAGEQPQATTPPDRHSSAVPAVMPVAPVAATPTADVVPAPAERRSGADPDTTGSVRPQPPRATPTAAPSPGTAAVARTIDRFPAALRNAAAGGDAAAEYEIASRLADGRGVAQNLAEAAAWFERAAGKGVAPAQFRLGGLYEKGIGVRKNLETARRLYISAAEAGHAKAMHNLAVLYAEGIDGKPDYQTAASWFRKAADLGVIDSQYNLAVLYARGIGVEVNLAEAFKWFALAGREGDRESAKKRDDIAARLDKASLAAAMAAAQAWQAQPQPEAATQVRAPAGGWEAAPVGSTPKRHVGPKVEAQPRRPVP